MDIHKEVDVDDEYDNFDKQVIQKIKIKNPELKELDDKFQ